MSGLLLAANFVVCSACGYFSSRAFNRQERNSYVATFVAVYAWGVTFGAVMP